MKNHTYFFTLVLASILFSCAPKQQAKVMVSQNPPSLEVGTFWIGSSKSGKAQTKEGHMAWEDCYLLNNNSTMIQNPMGTYDVQSHDFSGNELWCKPINNLDYEEGYIYKVSGTKSYSGKEMVSITVDEVLLKEKDPMFEKGEIIDMYIGPDMIDSQSFHGQPIKCHQVMYLDNPRSKDWSPYCGIISGLDFEEDYLYKVRVRRTHVSEFELKSSTIEHPFMDEVILLLKMQRVQ